MANFSIAEIKRIGQPESVMNRRVAEHWTGPAYMRKLSPYVSQIFLKFNVSPMTVTWLMVFSGWLASWLLTNPFLWAALLALLVAQLQMLLDCSDGEVARVSQKFNPAGVFVDRIGHYTTECFLAIAFSIRIYQNGDLTDLIWGLVLALLIVFNKLLNDLVHVTRALSKMDQLAEDPKLAEPKNSLLKTIRNLFRFFPIQRLFHSIELSIIFAISAIVQQLFANGFERLTLQFLTLAAFIVVFGHAVSVLNSNRLKH